MNSQERVYNYEEGRNTVPMDNRYAFDLDKLVNAGVVFVTPAMDGDPQSPTYKEWLDEGGSHLLTLMNVLKSSENGWIRKAITKRSDTSGWKNNFVEKLYDGKYNQILWSLEKLGIDPNDMVIEDNSLQESIRRILKEETDFTLRVRRIISELDSLLLQKMKDAYKPETICRFYKSSQELFEHIAHSVISDIYYTHFDDYVDDLSEEWEKMYYFMFEYLHHKYGNEIDQYYHINCGD